MFICHLVPNAEHSFLEKKMPSIVNVAVLYSRNIKLGEPWNLFSTCVTYFSSRYSLWELFLSGFLIVRSKI